MRGCQPKWVRGGMQQEISPVRGLTSRSHRAHYDTDVVSPVEVMGLATIQNGVKGPKRVGGKP